MKNNEIRCEVNVRYMVTDSCGDDCTEDDSNFAFTFSGVIDHPVAMEWFKKSVDAMIKSEEESPAMNGMYVVNTHIVRKYIELLLSSRQFVCTRKLYCKDTPERFTTGTLQLVTHDAFVNMHNTGNAQIVPHDLNHIPCLMDEVMQAASGLRKYDGYVEYEVTDEQFSVHVEHLFTRGLFSEFTPSAFMEMATDDTQKIQFRKAWLSVEELYPIITEIRLTHIN